MNSEQLNNWLALLANVGVVVGLLLLAYELREAQHFAETQAAVQRFDQMQSANTEMAMSDSLGRIRINAKSDGVPSLTPDEFYRLQRWEQSVVLRMRRQYVQYVRGYLDEATAEGFAGEVPEQFQYWQDLGVNLGNGEFSQAVVRAAGKEGP